MPDIDLIKESLSHAQLKRDSMLSFTRSAIGARIQFHRDVVGLSILLLGGVVTLLNINSDTLVKTVWLLYAAGGVLILTVIFSLVVRVQLIQFLQSVVGVTETWLSNINNAVKELRGIAIQDNPPATEAKKAIAIDKLINAEAPIDTPQLGKINDDAHKIAAGLFMLALIMIALALLVRVSS